MPRSFAPPELEFTTSKNYTPPVEWQSAASLLSPNRPPTPLERQAIAEVHELAERFAAGTCSLAEVKAATNGNQRRLAVQFTPPKDPAFRPLMALLDALVSESQQSVVTKQGTFLLGELIDAGMRISYEDGQEFIQLRSFWPWRVKPDPERGIEGERGEAVFRRPDQRGPLYGSFSRLPTTEAKEHKPDWWQAESTDEVPF